jgi:hypothetical protein
MSMFGGLGRAVKAFATPDNLMQIGAILKDTSSGGMDNFMNVQRLMATRQDRQRALDLEERQKTAIANLLGQFKPDTQTPQMNDLIGQLNQRQAQFGDAPEPMERVKPAFDLSNPATMGAVGQYLQSGGALGDIGSLREMFRPPVPKYTNVDPTDTIYQTDPETGQMTVFNQGAPRAPTPPSGFQWKDNTYSSVAPIPGFIQGRSELAAGTRAPRRPSGGGGGGGAKYTATKRLSNGQIGYLVNGAWYDNPEGR